MDESNIAANGCGDFFVTWAVGWECHYDIPVGTSAERFSVRTSTVLAVNVLTKHCRTLHKSDSFYSETGWAFLKDNANRRESTFCVEGCCMRVLARHIDCEEAELVYLTNDADIVRI